MPTFWQGRNLIRFAAFAKRIDLFPGGEATTVFTGQLKDYHTSKGGIWLMKNKPLPLELIAEIGIEEYTHRQRARIDFLETAIAREDDGRSNSFFCLAAALLTVDRLNTALERAANGENLRYVLEI